MAVLNSPARLLEKLAQDSVSNLADETGIWTFAELAQAAKTAQSHWERSTGGTPLRLFLPAQPTRQFVSQWLGALAAGHLVIPHHPQLPQEKLQCLLSRYQGSTENNLQKPERETPSGLGLMTSGSTGEPKIVVLSHHRYFWNAQAVLSGFELQTPDRLGVLLPLHHSFGLITQLLSGLMRGGEIYLSPKVQLPGQLISFLQTHQIETLAGVPGTFQLLTLGKIPPFESVSHLTLAGAALDPGLIKKLKVSFPRARIWVGYGLTEAGPRVSAISDQDPQFWQGSAGKALPDVQIKIENENLYIQSPSTMDAYLDAPQETQAILQDNWLLTQDIARQDANGYLFIRGRKDDIFISGGEKIAPLEIEHVLSQHPGIKQAAVWGSEDPLLGQRIEAMLILADTELKGSILRQYCRQYLEPVLVPQRFYQTETLPQTTNGKLMRKALSTWSRKKI